jgi:hypothetical protein
MLSECYTKSAMTQRWNRMRQSDLISSVTACWNSWERTEAVAMVEVCSLPNGYMLYREPNEVGGHRYWSDEVGGGVCVWDTCLVDSSTLLMAIAEEERHRRDEQREAERATAAASDQ